MRPAAGLPYILLGSAANLAFTDLATHPPKPGLGSPFTSYELLVPAVQSGQCTAYKDFVLFCFALFRP